MMQTMPSQTTAGTGPTVMVVDDEPLVRTIERRVLEDVGYQVGLRESTSCIGV